MSARILIFLLIGLLCGTARAAESVQAPMPVLMPPIPPSPIDQFRQWLRMPAPDREKTLREYPEAKQVVLRRKLLAYEAMPAEQRERRLRMLELRWYLRPLMSAPPQQRGDYLKMIPVRLHDLVTSRIEHWDALAANTRADILASDQAREMVTRYFVHLRRPPITAQELHPLDARQRAQLQQNLKVWKETSPSHRERMGRQLSAFFELPKADQNKALGQLSEGDRREMQKTLDAFERLSPEQRRACVESFQKFASMTPRERGAFMRNAARWQEMTLQERETWKRLVQELPPMPPEPLPVPPSPQAALPPGDKLATKD